MPLLHTTIPTYSYNLRDPNIFFQNNVAPPTIKKKRKTNLIFLNVRVSIKHNRYQNKNSAACKLPC